MRLIFPTLALAMIHSTPSAHANDIMARPMFELGAGTETGIGAEGTFNVLIKVRTGVNVATAAMSGPDQFIIAQIDGAMAVNPTDTGDRIPYMNIRFIPVALPADTAGPVGSTLDVISTPGTQVTFQFAPAGLHRDTRIGRDFALRVSLVGVEVNHLELLSSEIGFFLQAAAEMIGWKMIEQNGGYGTLHGFRLGGINAEVGLAFNIGHAFIVKIGIGGRADVTFGRNALGGTIQSDQEAYARLVVSLTRYIQVFSQIGLLNISDGNFDPRTLWQFMGGLHITFL